jgi:hypothetical protein
MGTDLIARFSVSVEAKSGLDLSGLTDGLEEAKNLKFPKFPI